MALCVMPSFGSEPPETLSIATGEWAPWTGKKLPRYGFVNDVVRRAFATQGYDVEFRFLPWSRAYMMMEECEFAAASYAYPSSEREEKALYSDPVTQEEIVFFSPKPFDWEKLTDLEDHRIGITLGNSYTDEFREMINSEKLTGDPHARDLLGFRKLLAHRIDIFPCSRMRGRTILGEHFTREQRKSIHVNPKPLGTVTGHLLFPKASERSEDLRVAFNEGLSRIKNRGVYSELLERLGEGEYDEKQEKE